MHRLNVEYRGTLALVFALLLGILLLRTEAQAQCPVCGNGIVEAGEECDDGNTTAWDGCSPTCTIEPQCYDVLNISDTGALDAKLTQAINSAISDITASGVTFDWTNISHRQMVFDRLPAKLQCALNLNGGTGAAAVASAAVTCPPPPEGNCIGTYSSSTDYCGVGCEGLLDTSCNGYDCLNCGCFQHDNCTGGLCIRGACQFIGNGNCDSKFFTTARDTCGRQQLISGPSRVKAACSILVYGIAKLYGLFNAHASPLCDPTHPTTCAGCDQCKGCTGSSCSDTHILDCEPCATEFCAACGTRANLGDPLDFSTAFGILASRDHCNLCCPQPVDVCQGCCFNRLQLGDLYCCPDTCDVTGGVCPQ